MLKNDSKLVRVVGCANGEVMYYPDISSAATSLDPTYWRRELTYRQALGKMQSSFCGTSMFTCCTTTLKALGLRILIAATIAGT